MLSRLPHAFNAIAVPPSAQHHITDTIAENIAAPVDRLGISNWAAVISFLARG
jgi:hypothetical protein